MGDVIALNRVVVRRPTPGEAVIALGPAANDTRPAGSHQAHAADTRRVADMFDLRDLVGLVRRHFRIPKSLDDEAILSSLEEIARETRMKARWFAAFNSTVGLYLSLSGSDLNTSLNRLVAIVPLPRC